MSSKSSINELELSYNVFIMSLSWEHEIEIMSFITQAPFLTLIQFTALGWHECDDTKMKSYEMLEKSYLLIEKDKNKLLCMIFISGCM